MRGARAPPPRRARRDVLNLFSQRAACTAVQGRAAGRYVTYYVLVELAGTDRTAAVGSHRQ